jgi:U1 small nuclear ribonucleoprotein 70kDa
MASNSNAMRQATPRGQMTRGANSGPAVMLMPPDVRSIFLPNPPLPPVPRVQHRRKHCITGVAQYLKCFETTIPPARILQPTPQSLAIQKKENKKKLYYETQLQPAIASYRQNQKDTAGSLLFGTMNCYNTLFIGRLAYECTEMKLLRQMEQFGTVKDLRIIMKKTNTKQNESSTSSSSSSSRGYAFCEYEHEEDMKRAYRAADGLLIENRPIVVDVERGHTVPDWLPRRLGGGLGMTRPSKEQGKPITRPGRYDPHKPEHNNPPSSMASMSRGGPPPMPRGGYGGPPPIGYGGGRDIAERERGDSYYGTTARGGPPQQRPMMGGPPPPYGGPPYAGGPPYGGGPPPHRPPPPRGGNNDQDYPPPRNKRYRSRSPDRYGGGSSGGRRRL